MHACIYTLLYNVTTHVGPSLPSRIRILHSPLSLSTRLQAATGMNGDRGFNNLVGCAMTPLEVRFCMSISSHRMCRCDIQQVVRCWFSAGGGSVEEEVSNLLSRHFLEPGYPLSNYCCVYPLGRLHFRFCAGMRNPLGRAIGLPPLPQPMWSELLVLARPWRRVIFVTPAFRLCLCLCLCLGVVTPERGDAKLQGDCAVSWIGIVDLEPSSWRWMARGRRRTETWLQEEHPGRAHRN